MKSNIRILLIGEGSEKKNLIVEAKKEGVYKKNLFFEKQVPKKKISEYLSAANMCANFVGEVEETWANSANKFFDSLAAGKPVFLNHGGWMQDLVTRFDCGLSMYSKNIERVAKELDAAMSNDIWLQSSGKSAKELAKKFFDREILAEQLEKILILTKNNQPELVENVAEGIYK